MIFIIDIYEILGLYVILFQFIFLFIILIFQGLFRKKLFFIMEILKKIIIGMEGNIVL